MVTVLHLSSVLWNDIKGLQRRVTDCVSQIITLRRTLRTVDNNVAVLSMRIPRLNRRRQNLNVVGHIMSSMQSVIQVNTVQYIKLMSCNGKYQTHEINIIIE